VRTVELAGAVGSGKSTLAPELVRLLRDAGIDAVGVGEALAVQAPRRVGLTVDAPHGVRFAATHLRLLRLVGRELTRAAIDGSHRRRIAGLVLRLGARLRFLDARLASGQLLVIDEGFVQRAVNVFGWVPGPLENEELRRFLSLAPLADVVVVLDRDAGVATEQARARGLPSRVAAKTPAEADRFLARAAEVVEAAAAILEERGVPTIRIRNDSTVEDAVSQLARHLPVLAGSSSAPPPPVARIGLLAVPRIRRPLRRAAGPGLPEGLGSALDALAAGPWRIIRPLGRATGRSGSVLVAAGDERLVVKRYKPSVPVEQVEIEHAILRELETRHFPGPRLRRASDGTTLIRTDAGIFAAFEYLSGYRRSDDLVQLRWHGGRSRAQLHGAALGALHAALSGFVPAASSPLGVDVSAPARRTRDLAWHLRLLDEADVDPGRLPAGIDLDALRRELAESDAPLDGASLSAGVIHGDFGPYNVLTRHGDPLLIVDYELARFDWRIVDLATALPRYAAGGSASVQRIRAFLAGYLSRAPLSRDELALLPDLLALLSVRRATVTLARWAGSGDQGMLAETRQKLALARTIRSGRHVVARATRSD
jgi:Ser/Thr protein kinase RdoA (MazF antagonist)